MSKSFSRYTCGIKLKVLRWIILEFSENLMNVQTSTPDLEMEVTETELVLVDAAMVTHKLMHSQT